MRKTHTFGVRSEILRERKNMSFYFHRLIPIYVLSMATAFKLQQKSRETVKETTWPARVKVFTNLSFIELVF